MAQNCKTIWNMGAVSSAGRASDGLLNSGGRVWRKTARQFGIWGPLAQLVEHLTFNQVVARSNRARPTIHKTIGLVPIFL